MLLGNKPGSLPTAYDPDFAAQAINDGRYAEAWIILSRLKEENVPALLNSALCLMHAEEFRRALETIDKALATVLPDDHSRWLPSDSVTDSLKRRQAQENTHMNPVTAWYVAAFPFEVTQSLLRLRVDCCSALGMYSEVARTASRLGGVKFANVDRALEKNMDNG